VYLRAVYRARESPGGPWREFIFDADPTAPGDDPALLGFAQPWAIITAWNPTSERARESDNIRAQGRLVEAVRALGLTFRPAEGHDGADPPSWREESILVEKLELDAALHLLNVFRQRAAVYSAGGKVGLLFADTGKWETHPIRILEAKRGAGH
jgi:hypothetical protein